MADSDDKPVVFKKSARLNRKFSRKRRRSSGKSDSGGEADELNVALGSMRSRKKNPMIQSTSGILRRQKLEKADESSDDSEEEDRSLLLGLQYKSSSTGERSGPQDMGATAVIETETDFRVDSQAQFERTQEIIKNMKGKADDKVYKGMATYGQFMEKRDTAAGKASSGFVRKGPIRAAPNIRLSVVWDYKPDLCKDYKETGFCTFGDSCKFVHDRTDYKHGWELERDWKEGVEAEDDAKYEISDDEEQFPFKCFLCRDSFKNPIVTKCKHYFCEQCALDHYRKSQKCSVCDKNTGGVFNPAKELIAKLKGEENKKKRGKDSSGWSDSDEVEETEMEQLPGAGATEADEPAAE